MKILFLLVCLALPLLATIRPTDGSYTQVSANVTASSSGDTITIPTGTFTWASKLTIPNTKGITISGDGVGASIVIRNTADGTELINIATNATVSTVITGIEFQDNHGTNQPSPNSNFFQIAGGPTNAWFRLTQCKFFSNPIGDKTDGVTAAIKTLIQVFDSQFGLIDHNTFLSGANSEMIHNSGRTPSTATDGVPDWTNDVVQSSMLFVEYNTFTNNAVWWVGNTGTTYYYAGCSAIQNYYGSRLTFRNNTLNFCQVDVHGTAGNVAGRWFEIYNNTWTVPAAAAGFSYDQSQEMAIRGGSGVIFTNSFSYGAGSTGGNLLLQEEDAGSYPLLYQVGQGKMGVSPTTQTTDPLYVWNNGSTLGAPGVSEVTPSTIVLNRDYFYTSNSSGAKGGYTAFTNPYPWPGSTITSTSMTGKASMTGKTKRN